MTSLLATVIGGIRTEEGPIMGAAVVVFLYFLLARYGELSILIQGAILVVIMLTLPEGIVGLIRKTRAHHFLSQLVARRWANGKNQGGLEKLAAFLAKR
jgi:branched-chain amino acid transport system permease protein